MFRQLLIYILLFLCVNVQIYGQDDDLDILLSSKKQLQNKGLTDSLKIEHYKVILSYYTNTEINPDSIIFYGNDIIASFKSKENDYRAFIENVLNNMSVANWYKSDYEKAIKIIEYKLNLFENQDIGQTITDYMNLGLFEIELGNYLEGMKHLFYSEKSNLELLEQKDTTLSEEKIFNNLSIIYNNLGLVFEQIGDPKSAIEFFEKSAEYLFMSGNENPDDLALTYGNICVQLIESDQLEKAKVYIEKALKESEKSSNEKTKGFVKYNYAAWQEAQGNIKGAELFYLDAIEHYKNQGNKNELGKCFRDLGQLYTETNKLKEATYYLSQAEEKFTESKSKKDMAELHLAYSIYYDKIGSKGEAYDYLKKYHKENDKIINDQVKQQGIRMEFSKKYEKRILKDSLENAKQEALNIEKLKRKDIALKTKKNQQLILGIGLLVSAILLFLVFKRYRQNLKQKEVIETQHLKLSSKNKEITDSINYAKRIQSAILPDMKSMEEIGSGSFNLYLPKDVVAGDFYWLEELSENEVEGKRTTLYAAADCTGHGVPGALVSVVCINALNRAVREFKLMEPSEILDLTKSLILNEFDKSDETINDGMDIALISLKSHQNSIENELSYAGANNPLWIIRKGKFDTSQLPDKKTCIYTCDKEIYTLLEIKPDKQPIGKYEHEVPFTNTKLNVQKGDHIYVFSDGFVDQFGGEKGKKFKSANFRKKLFEIQSLPLKEQKELLLTAFNNWKGDQEQVDDIVIIGVKV